MPTTKKAKKLGAKPWWMWRRVSCPECGFTKHGGVVEPRQDGFIFIHHKEKEHVPNTESLTVDVDVFECPRCHEMFRPGESFEKYRTDACLEEEDDP